MYTQKTYQFPAVEGVNDLTATQTPSKVIYITKTLAPPTNIRMKRLLQLMGYSSFEEMSGKQDDPEEVKTEKILTVITRKMDIAIDDDKLTDMLDITLIEGSVGIDVTKNGVDTRLSDEVMQDFFDQRGASMKARADALKNHNQQAAKN